MFEGFHIFSKDRKVKEINALKSEHLKEGVKPIMACVFNREKSEEEDAFSSLNTANALRIDYYDSDEAMREKGLTNAGERTYLISPNNEQDKFSYDYLTCTGVIAVGRSKESGKEISFMSHEDPTSFLRDVKENFILDLRKRASELKALSEEGTVDAVVFGGNYLRDSSDYQKTYIESIALLNKIINDELGFSPVTLSPSTTRGASQAVYFDTQNKRIYIMKPEDLEKRINVPYVASKAREEEQKWGAHSNRGEDF